MSPNPRRAESFRRPIAAAVAAVALAASVLTATGPAGAQEDTRPTGYTGGKPDRIHGDDRYDTSRRVAHRLLENRLITTGGTVVIASGESFPDALSAASLAGAMGAPIVLWPDDAQHRTTGYQLNLIDLLRPARIYVVGGTSAISDDAIEGLPAHRVMRLAGDDRYGTSRRVAQEAFGSERARRTPDTWCSSDMPDAFVVSGQSYADAVGAAGASYAGVIPVVLADPHSSRLPEDSLALLDYLFTGDRTGCAGRSPSLLIVGGRRAVPAGVESQLRGLGYDVSRAAGDDRYETNHRLALELSERCAGCYLRPGAVLATGDNFPDALSAAPLAGLGGDEERDLILLVPPEGQRGGNGRTYWLRETVTASGIFTTPTLSTVVIGGHAALPDDVGIFSVRDSRIEDPGDSGWHDVDDAWTGGFTHKPGDLHWRIPTGPRGTDYIRIGLAEGSFTGGGYAAAWRMYVPSLDGCERTAGNETSVFPRMLRDQNGNNGKILFLCLGADLTAQEAADRLNSDRSFSAGFRATVRAGSRDQALSDMPRSLVYTAQSGGSTRIGVLLKLSRDVRLDDRVLDGLRLIGLCDVRDGDLHGAGGGSCYGRTPSRDAVRAMVADGAGIPMTAGRDSTNKSRRTMELSGGFESGRVVYLSGSYSINPDSDLPNKYDMSNWLLRAPSHDHAILASPSGDWIAVRTATQDDLVGAKAWPD